MPYPARRLTKAQVSEIYVDPAASPGFDGARRYDRERRDPATLVPSTVRRRQHHVEPAAALLVANSYLICSEVSYLYKPTVGYVMSARGVTLGDSDYTRPRQVPCVIYSSLPAASSCPTP